MRLIDADRLLTEKMKSKYYHLPNGDIAIPLIDIENAPTIESESCRNIQGILEYLDAELRCTMCRNPMKSDRGCDGGCKYDEKLYEDIMNIFEKRVKSIEKLPSIHPDIIVV